jgi:hypothetical protein
MGFLMEAAGTADPSASVAGATSAQDDSIIAMRKLKAKS